MTSAQADEYKNFFGGTVLVGGKIEISSAEECFQANDSQKGVFDTGYKMAISVQNPMLKVNYFL